MEKNVFFSSERVDGRGMCEYMLNVAKTVGICATSFESAPLSSAACTDHLGKGKGTPRAKPLFSPMPSLKP